MRSAASGVAVQQAGDDATLNGSKGFLGLLLPQPPLPPKMIDVLSSGPSLLLTSPRSFLAPRSAACIVSPDLSLLALQGATCDSISLHCRPAGESDRKAPPSLLAPQPPGSSARGGFARMAHEAEVLAWLDVCGAKTGREWNGGHCCRSQTQDWEAISTLNRLLAWRRTGDSPRSSTRLWRLNLRLRDSSPASGNSIVLRCAGLWRDR